MEKMSTEELVPRIMSIIDLGILKTHTSGDNHAVILPYDLGRQFFRNDVAIKCLKVRYRLKGWSLVPVFKLTGRGSISVRLSRINNRMSSP